MWCLCYLCVTCGTCVTCVTCVTCGTCGTCAWLIIICRWSPRQTDAGSQLQHKSRFHLCSRHRHLRHYHVFWWWRERSIAIFLICSTPTLVAENEPHWPLAPGGWLADTSAMILRGLSRCHLCNLRMVISTRVRTMTMIKGAPRCHLLPAWCRTHQYRFHGGNVNIMQQHR